MLGKASTLLFLWSPLSLLLSLSLLPLSHGQTDTTAALIVGGYIAGEGSGILNTVEIFGCPTPKAVTPFPSRNYLMGGSFVYDDDIGHVLVCGGSQCERGSCGPSAGCFRWTPLDNLWQEIGSLSRARTASILAQVPNVTNPGDTTLYPTMVGVYEETDMYNPDTNTWSLYESIPDDNTWYSSNCLIQYQNFIYHIGQNVSVIDPTTWSIDEQFAETPEEAREVFRCAGVEIDNDPGIFTKSGLWFNLTAKEWVQKTAPPLDPAAPRPNSMWSFQGKPTIFGAAVCAGPDACEYEQVIQYDPEEDDWIDLGTMELPRRFHEVIEVPISFCDLLPDSLETTTAPPIPPVDLDNAMLVIGGYEDNAGNNIDFVEVFGCQGPPRSVSSLPFGVFGAGGVLVPGEEDDEGHVLVCGGGQCSGSNCDPSTLCLQWTPSDNTWTESSNLTQPFFAHIMALVPDIDTGNLDEFFPAVLGFRNESEIFDPETNTWSPYQPLPGNWYSLECFTQLGQKIYHIARSVEELDILTWQINTLIEDLPTEYRSPLMCAGVEIDGVLGIMTQAGNWLRLDTLQWEQKDPAPLVPSGGFVNEMVRFRGRPTIVGAPRCNAVLDCTRDQIVQYDPDLDTWILLGQLQQQRRLHTVIEIPQSFCDFLPEATTETPQTTTSSSNPFESTAAVVIGGFLAGGESGLVGDVEIFGCGDSIDAYVPPMPYRMYLMAATYVHDTNGGFVLVCGGSQCEGNPCRVSDRCYQWRPGNEAWQEAPTLQRPRTNHILAQIPDIDSGDLTVTNPAVVGYHIEVEMLTEGSWSDYREIPIRRWLSSDCLIQYGGKIYHIYENVTEIDPLTWEDQDLGVVSAGDEEVAKCSGLEIEGQPGIYTRSGLWFNLSSSEWIQTSPVPALSGVTPPNSMWNFRGLPTVFGAPRCNGINRCEYADVIQFGERGWTLLGEIKTPRRFHEVVEVPREFCATRPSRDTAALIIGGMLREDSVNNGFMMSSTEVFGCGDAIRSKVLSYPNPVLQVGAAFVHDESGGYVLSCGGSRCSGGVCQLTDECFEWRPSDNQWTSAPRLNEPRFSHLMAQIPVSNSGSAETFPTVMGFRANSEMLQSGQWNQYEEIPSRFWDALDCFIQYGGKIYHIDEEVSVLDPTDFSVYNMSGPPLEPAGSQPRKCSGVSINDVPGIYIRDGFWLNLDNGNWEEKTALPTQPEADMPNSMWSFQGHPTVFGAPQCNPLGQCRYDQILQYDPVMDDWTYLGTMVEPRRYHEVVEIPRYFCDLLEAGTTTISPTSSTSTSTMTSTGTITSTAAITTTTANSTSSLGGDGVRTRLNKLALVGAIAAQWAFAKLIDK